MRSAWSKMGMLAAAALAAASCSVTDGSPLDTSTLGVRACAADLDCGRGRHCEDGVCAVACVSSKDCALSLADPGAPNDLACSPCGRCVAPGTRDAACLAATDQPCSASSDCASLGPGWSCAGGTCALSCKVDDDCGPAGRGWGCGDAGLCVRKCFRDQDCWFFGYRWACALPPGTDPVANGQSDHPVYGACAASDGNLGIQPMAPGDPPSAAYEGVWGFLAVAAVRVDDVPILTRLNSANIQHLLVRARRAGADLVFTMRWCANDIVNFNDDDRPVFNLFQVVVPDHNVDSILARDAHAAAVPPLAPGAAFTTDAMIDLRGARLANPATDPLPTYHDLSGQWDQDRDGFPGMTANVTGALSGNLYQAQRWQPQFHVQVYDANHLGGFVTGPSDAAVLGATTMDLVNDSVTSAHPVADRSYFRGQRLGNDASCADVLELKATAGSWLEYAPHFDPARQP